MAETSDPWFDETPERAQTDAVLHVDVGGYEGPLDLLLDLARKQKVDLSGVSVLALAEQYLSFIESIRQQRIEIAADYLVMAAWLAYLKSRLMVPRQTDDEEPSGEEMAALLQFRLARLEAMRDAAGRLLNRPRLGRSFQKGKQIRIHLCGMTFNKTSIVPIRNETDILALLLLCRTESG